MTYEFMTVADAIRFVARGTSLDLMTTLRYGRIVHIITTSADIQEVNHTAKILGGVAIG